MKKIFAACAFVLFAAACAMQAPERPQPHFAYKQYPPIKVDVAVIEVKENYRMPMNTPNVEHLMPQPLPQAVADWARSRFVAVGSAGTMTITVGDASVVRKDLPRTNGVQGWFTVDQAERYDAKVAIDFRVDGSGFQSGAGNAAVTRGQSIGENASVQERDRTWTKMEEAMMTDLDAATQKMLQERLAFILR